MIDKPDLFKELLRTFKRRKPIQVKGGILISKHYGMAEVVVKDSSSYLFKNTLLVPNLGINLILVRRLCKNRIKRHFNTKNIYFKKDNKILIYI